MSLHKFSLNTFSQTPVVLPQWRSRFVLVLLLLCLMVLLGRAAYLQIVNHDFLQEKGEKRFTRVLNIPATRGRLTDRHGQVLAISTPVRSIWADPKEINLDPSQLKALSAALGIDASELTRKLTSARDFVFLKRQLSPEAAQQIVDLQLPGVHQQKEYRRYYPDGEVFASVLGFTGVDDQGLEGLELALDKELTGHPGSRRVIRDRRGRVVEDIDAVAIPRNGQDIALSLDAKLQYLAHTALQQAVAAHRAKAGAAVVLDVRSGEILALANAPTFNPNDRFDRHGPNLRNRAITDAVEPGSTMKAFIVAEALERGFVNARTAVDTGPGYIMIGRDKLSDTRPHGVMTMTEVIQKSSNVGAVKVSRHLSPTQMWTLFDRLGFGNSLGLGFPGEGSGVVRPATLWRPVEQATMSYGYGISTTPLQMARAYLAFAREGTLVPLSLVRRPHAPVVEQRVFSPQTAEIMRHMLAAAVKKGGTAPAAQIPGYQVAGKTGTAYKLRHGKYVKEYLSSFVGFAPLSDPRIVVAVMIDEPSAGKHYGGSVAAPVFARIASGGLRILGVPPDKPLLAERQKFSKVLLSALKGSAYEQ